MHTSGMVRRKIQKEDSKESPEGLQRPGSTAEQYTRELLLWSLIKEYSQPRKTGYLPMSDRFQITGDQWLLSDSILSLSKY